MVNSRMGPERIIALWGAKRRPLARQRTAPVHKAAWGLALVLGLAFGVAVGLSGIGRAQTQASAANSARHAIAMHGEPALPANFTHMPYVNPDAPKGGRLVFGVLGTFDSLNPLIVRGTSLQQIRGYVIESLLARGNDEPFTLYGLLAESVETDDARSYVTFHINPKAAFSDGKPVTAEDVLFSRELLRTKGRPNHRLYYAKIAKAEALDARTVRFDLTGANDRELPLILGLMPILPKHATDEASFEETSMTPLDRLGPLSRRRGEAGRQHRVRAQSRLLGPRPADQSRPVEFRRGPLRLLSRGECGASKPSSAGLYDFRVEIEPLRWSSGYDFPAAQSGQVVKEVIANGSPRPSEFLVFNSRRPQFSDIRVREALSLLFDFEWINQNYFFSLYQRSGGFFAGSELSSYGVNANARERELLKPFPGEVRADIMDGTFKLPASDSSGRDRETLRRALGLFAQAGYEVVQQRAAPEGDR